MVISTENQITYNGDGINTAWPYTFKTIDKSDVKLMLIYENGTRVEIDSDYYVDAVNNTVYYPGYAPGAEPPEEDQPPKVQEGQKLMLYRQLPLTQEADLGDSWPFSIIEKGLDKLTMLVQDVYGWYNRNVMTFKQGTLAWNGDNYRIADVLNPVDQQDVATKDYVDKIIAGIVAEGNDFIMVDTVAVMKETDLQDGMFCATGGYYSVNDGGKGVYRIRTATPLDVEDGTNIIILDNGKVAEKLTGGSYVEFLFPKYVGTVVSEVNGNRGDCEIIKTKNTVLMIDAQRSLQDQTDYIVQYMLDHGITKVDYFLLTHYHIDHYAGIPNLLAQNDVDFSNTKWLIPVGVVSTKEDYAAQVTYVQNLLAGRDVTIVDTDRTIDLDIDVSMYLFNASDESRTYYEPYKDLGTAPYNLYSINALIYHKDVVAYFSGDSYGESFKFLNENYDLPNVDLFKVNHHGEVESVSTEALKADMLAYLQSINPKYSVFNSNSLGGQRPELRPLAYMTQMYGEVYQQVEDVEFISDGETLVKTSANKLRLNSVSEDSWSVFIDSSYDYSNGLPDGTEDRPFKEATDALSFFSNVNGYITLNFADGTYYLRLKNIKPKITIKNTASTVFSKVICDGVTVNFLNDVTIGNLQVYNTNITFSEDLSMEMTTFDYSMVTIEESTFIARKDVTVTHNAETSSSSIFNMVNGLVKIEGTLSITNWAGRGFSLNGFEDICIGTLTVNNIGAVLFRNVSGIPRVTIYAQSLTSVSSYISTRNLLQYFSIPTTRKKSGPTSERPDTSLIPNNHMYWDWTINKMLIYIDRWIDIATGSEA